MDMNELTPDDVVTRAVAALLSDTAPDGPPAGALEATRQALRQASQVSAPHGPSLVRAIWRHTMAHKVASCGAALGAVAAAMALVLVMQTGSGVAFADVLANMAEVQTLHVKLNFGSRSGEAWAKRPNMIRINYADGTYEISNGPRLWVVDEKANKAVEKPSSYYQDAQHRGLDVMDMMCQLSMSEDLSGFFSEGPAGRVDRDGTTLDVYRMEFEQHGTKLRFEALADSQTHLLHSATLEDEKDGVRRTVFALSVLDHDQPLPDGWFLFQPKEGMEVTAEEPMPEAPAPDAAKGSTVSGRIVWASNGKPVPEARVTLVGYGQASKGGMNDKFHATVETDRDGRWQATGAPAGEINLSVRSWEMEWPSEPTFANNIGTLEHSRIAVDGVSAYSGLNFTVHKPDTFFARITINVTDEDGKPVQNAGASLWNDDPGSSASVYADSEHHRQFTGPDGKFDARNVWPTTKPARLAVFPFERERGSSGLAAWGASLPEPFIVERGKRYHFGVVIPKARTMNLRVAGPDGKPAEGVCVAVWDAAIPHSGPVFPPLTSQGGWGLVLTDGAGRATVTGLAPEKEVVVVLIRLADGAKNCYGARTAWAFVRLNVPKDRAPTSRQVTFDDRPIRIEGSVAPSDGAKPAWVLVTVDGLEDSMLGGLSARVKGGDFVIKGMPPGETRLGYYCENAKTERDIRRCVGTLRTEPGKTYRVKLVGDRLELLGEEPAAR